MARGARQKSFFSFVLLMIFVKIGLKDVWEINLSVKRAENILYIFVKIGLKDVRETDLRVKCAEIFFRYVHIC